MDSTSLLSKWLPICSNTIYLVVHIFSNDLRCQLYYIVSMYDFVTISGYYIQLH